jgi:hypothetical protein
MKPVEQSEFSKKVMDGLQKAYAKLIEFKRDRKSVLVVLKDKKIVLVKP